MSKLVKKKNYSLSTDGDNVTSVTFDLQALSDPTNHFSAGHVAYTIDDATVTLSFGQLRAGVLMAQLDVRHGRDAFVQVLRQSPGFLESLAKNAVLEPPRSQGDSPSLRYLMEDANMTRLAFSGPQAEMSFFMIPPALVLRFFDPHAEVDTSQIKPVVTVTLPTGALRWLLLGLVKALVEEGHG